MACWRGSVVSQHRFGFWPEWVTSKGLDCLGRALETLYLNYISQTGAAGDLIDLTWFDRAVEASPRSYLAHDLLGWGWYKNQEVSRAKSCFETALSFNDKGVGALSGLMWCAVAEKNGTEPWHMLWQRPG